MAESLGEVANAKGARLDLAKAIAKEKGLAWPDNLSDAEAKDLIWMAHTMNLPLRSSGFRGTRNYFAAYLGGRHDTLKKKFGPLLTKELLRRGVMGQELGFMTAVAQAPGKTAPRLVYADWLDEHDRTASAECLRLAAELEEGVSAERAAEIGRRRKEIRAVALQEWSASSSGQRLAEAGKFVALTAEGLPMLSVPNLDALVRLGPERTRLILALDLSWIPTEIPPDSLLARLPPPDAYSSRETEQTSWLCTLDLRNVTSLTVSRWGMSDAELRILGGEKSPFKNLRTLNLRSSPITNFGSMVLDWPTLKHVTRLDLTRTGIGGQRIEELRATGRYREIITGP